MTETPERVEVRQRLLKAFKGSEIRLMNYLQERGLVSDNAVWLMDCATVDLVSAAQALRLRGD